MHRLAPALLLSAALLTACSGDDPTLTGSSGAAGEPSSPPATTAPATSEPVPSASAAPSAAGTTGASVEEPVGGPLTVTEVRAARQDGFDRVVLELAGEQPGQPGWRVEYVDDPRQAGSGDPVEVDGEAVLAVVVSGTGYPFDTGQEEAESAQVGGDLEVVQDVVLGSVFEGQYEAFVGLSEQRPFTVTRLADPARVVIDISHP